MRSAEADEPLLGPRQAYRLSKCRGRSYYCTDCLSRRCVSNIRAHQHNRQILAILILDHAKRVSPSSDSQELSNALGDEPNSAETWSPSDNVPSGCMCTLLTGFFLRCYKAPAKKQLVHLNGDVFVLHVLAKRHDSGEDRVSDLCALKKLLGPTRGIIVPSCVELVPSLVSGFCIPEVHPWTTTKSLH